jgi:alpha-glucosidase (family GH31 glycosyl hydrolase)
MFLVPEVYLKVNPLAVFSQDTSIPRPRNVVIELPENRIPVFVRESFLISLQNSTGVSPHPP